MYITCTEHGKDKHTQASLTEAWFNDTLQKRRQNLKNVS